MKKLIAILTLPLALQACGSIEYHPRGSASGQEAVIEAIREDNEALAAYLEEVQAQRESDSGLFKSVLNLAMAGAAFTTPISGMSSGMSMLLALNGMKSLNADAEPPVTIIYQGKEETVERSPAEAIQAYRQALAELANYDDTLAQAVMQKYASELDMSGLQNTLAEGISSPADLQGMCRSLASLGNQAETIYDSLKVPENLVIPAPFMLNGDQVEFRPLQASL